MVCYVYLTPPILGVEDKIPHTLLCKNFVCPYLHIALPHFVLSPDSPLDLCRIYVSSDSIICGLKRL